jgi:fatty acid desaturase
MTTQQPMTIATDTGAPRQGSDYAALSRRVREAGLMNRRHGYYVMKVVLTLGATAAGWALFFWLGDSWWQLVVAAYLGIAFTQLGFVGHDAGHKQIARTRRFSYALGLLHSNVGLGLSYGWWIDKHNRHHAHPNEVEKDPDMGPGALVFTLDQARVRRGIAKVWTRSQAYVFFPLLLLEGLNLHVAGVRALSERPRGTRWLEGTLLLLHFAAYLGAVFLVLSPAQGVAFIAVHQGVFGFYMGLAFAPNHKGMPVLGEEDKADYLRRQVLTSRNIRGGVFVDFVFGGLNYQIEHHLFPSMPRPNLRRAQAVVESFCAERGVPYLQTSFVASYAQVLSHLHAVGAPLRASPGRAQS